MIAHNAALDDAAGAASSEMTRPAETISISHSKIVGNEATSSGGGIFSGKSLDGHQVHDREQPHRHRGDGDQGGGIVNEVGTTKVVASTLTGNHSALDGGAIANDAGTLKLVRSTLSANTSGFDAAAVENGSHAILIDDTLADNRATGDGGGIKSYPTSVTRLNGVTVARNEAITGDGGGIDASGGVIDAKNSLIALNLIGIGLGPDCHEASPGGIVSEGHNLIGDTTDCTGIFGGVTNDILNIDPKIAQLAGNGGPTKTIALRANSKAINHAGNDAPKRDQRGVNRDNKPDIGAYERR